MWQCVFAEEKNCLYVTKPDVYECYVSFMPCFIGREQTVLPVTSQEHALGPKKEIY